MVSTRRITRRLSRDSRLGIGFLERAGITKSLVYTAHESNGALRLKPFHPYDPASENTREPLAMFHTGTTKKLVTTTEGMQETRDEDWLYLTAFSRNETEDELLRKSKIETEKLLKRVGLKSKEARNVIIEYNLTSIVIRAL
ncbi:MAG: hypothetical protein ACYDHP_10050 [Ferrimicrobium sp.]